MSHYIKILVAIDVYSEYQSVLEKALKISHKAADIHLVYTTLPMTSYQPFGLAYEGEFFNDICKQNKQTVHEIAENYKIPSKQVYCPVGSAAEQIHNVANDIGADLIVIGTHGKSGLKLLLGSTANGVLHGVKCDVLAVKV